MISVHCFECGPVATNAYLVTNTATHTAFVVDTPPESADVILQTAADAGCTLTDVLLTHTHWDHTTDCARIVTRTGAKVSVHSEDAYRLLEPMRHTIWPLPFTIERVIPDVLLEHGTHLEVAGIHLQVLHTPGHTEGGVCFVDEVHQRVFVGDTLFLGSVGRTDLPGGNMQLLLTSINEQLLVLPESFAVLPGHGPETTIGDERSSNQFLIRN